MPRILCPAGSEQHLVTSPNRLDVGCRVDGAARPADPEMFPCCGDYTRCQIWRVHKEIETGLSTKAQRDATRSSVRLGLAASAA